MNRWASQNPELATEGQMAPSPSTLRTSDQIRQEAKEDPRCLCAHAFSEHVDDHCVRPGCGCASFRMREWAA